MLGGGAAGSAGLLTCTAAAGAVGRGGPLCTQQQRSCPGNILIGDQSSFRVTLPFGRVHTCKGAAPNERTWVLVERATSPDVLGLLRSQQELSQHLPARHLQAAALPPPLVQSSWQPKRAAPERACCRPAQPPLACLHVNRRPPASAPYLAHACACKHDGLLHRECLHAMHVPGLLRSDRVSASHCCTSCRGSRACLSRHASPAAASASAAVLES